MGPALNIGAASNGYVLTDRGTWLNFKNRADLAVLVEGDKRLFNQYGVMLVSAAKHPQVKTAEGQKFVDWVVAGRPGGDRAYKIGGEQLFFPNASNRLPPTWERWERALAPERPGGISATSWASGSRRSRPMRSGWCPM
jgi:ABC-type tungstate transport system permease subunit